MLTFFDQDYSPSKCLCGESVAINIGAALATATSTGCNITGLTAAVIRQFIKNTKIGCVGRQVKFRNHDKQVHAIHISRSWFDADDIKHLDERKCIYFI